MDSINVPVKLLREYEQMGLNERELVILLRLLPACYSKCGLTLADIAAEFAVGEEEAAALVGPLIAKEILLTDTEGGEGSYTLDGLFMHLYEQWMIEKRRAKNAAKMRSGKAEVQKRHIVELGQLYRVFERELGRNLSPIENDKIGHWLEQDNHPPELIMEALTRAVLQGKASFAYIDKILFNWKQQGVQSPGEVAVKDTPPVKKPAKRPAGERVKDTWL